MWSGFSSEIETIASIDHTLYIILVACGAASHLRLKQVHTYKIAVRWDVACGAASHLRLKPRFYPYNLTIPHSRMWSGFSSEIETGLLEALSTRE